MQDRDQRVAAKFTRPNVTADFCLILFSTFFSQIPVQALVQFVEALECGYSKYKNPYHNLIHAADVTQTAHFLMLHTGLMVMNTQSATRNTTG